MHRMHEINELKFSETFTPFLPEKEYEEKTEKRTNERERERERERSRME